MNDIMQNKLNIENFLNYCLTHQKFRYSYSLEVFMGALNKEKFKDKQKDLL